MKIVLDTNVFVSGVFFGGPPHQILKAWHAGRLELAAIPGMALLDCQIQQKGSDLAIRASSIGMKLSIPGIAVELVISDEILAEYSRHSLGISVKPVQSF